MPTVPREKNMQEPDDALNDVLDTILGADRSRPDAALRGAVLGQTLSVLRRRRRWKRCAVAAGLVGCYLAGIATMTIGRAGGKAELAVCVSDVVRGSRDSAVRGSPDLAQAPTEGLPTQGRPAVEESAGSGDPRRAHESSATPLAGHHAKQGRGRGAGGERTLTGYQRLRRAGDQWLRESGDISRAVRDYARALDQASEQERAIAPGQDNWLLMALKDARTKERKDAQPQQN